MDRVRGWLVQPSSTNGTSNGQARANVCAVSHRARMPLLYALLRMVALVPMIPIRCERVFSRAARTPGSMTPKTGTSYRFSNIGSAQAEQVLQATTTAFTFCCRRKLVSSQAKRTTVLGDLVP